MLVYIDTDLNYSTIASCLGNLCVCVCVQCTLCVMRVCVCSVALNTNGGLRDRLSAAERKECVRVHDAYVYSMSVCE